MSDVLDALPRAVADLIAPHLGGEEDSPTLAAIGVEIGAKRDEAKMARKMSGIEDAWRAADEAYEGIDDANRGEVGDGGRWAKPMSVDGPLMTERRNRNPDHRSTAFLRLTSRYVDAGAAKLGEILLPADDKAFSFRAMPVPRLIKAKEDTSQVVHGDMGVPLTRPAQPGETGAPAAPPGAPPAGGDPMAAAAAALQAGGQPAPGATPGAPPPPAGQPGQALTPPGTPLAPASPTPPGHVPLTVKDLAVENIQMADEKAKAAETRIYNWLLSCQYRGEIRKVIFDAARIGVGVLKGPTPRTKRVMALTKQRHGEDLKVIIKDTIQPAAVWVDPWNIFPDPACGENIHDGSYIFERDHMSARQIRKLKSLPGYIGDAIDQVLDEGPNKAYRSETDRGPGSKRDKDRFEIWYFQGTLTKEEMRAIDMASGRDPYTDEDAENDKRDEVFVIVTLINDTVIRATINPLDSGSFPYNSMPWQRRAESWAGVGVAEQMRTPQRMVNAAVRALLNNAGKSAGSQLVIDQSAIIPADGLWTITPDKIWFKTNDGPQDVRQAMMAIAIPNVTEQLMSIITLAERFAEETTSIPLITQGQSGSTTPDTFGATQLQNNNANQLLRSIGYSFDDFITEPLIRQFYEWLLLDPDVPNEEKGEFEVDAHGSVALVERAIQDQSIAQMGNMAANPIYGIDPKKWAALFLKSKRLDPTDMQYTEEEQEKMAAAPPPEPPPVTVARINADTQIKLGVMKQTADQQTQQAEQRVADAANTLEGQKLHVQATVDLHEMEQKRQLAMLDYANRHQISLDQTKAELAQTAMKLQVEQQLNAINNAIHTRDTHAAHVVDVHKHAVDTAEAARQHAVDTDHAAVTHALDSAHAARQADQQTAEQRRQHTIDTGSDLFKHQNPPAVQVPGKAANGQAASQVNP